MADANHRLSNTHLNSPAQSERKYCSFSSKKKENITPLVQSSGERTKPTARIFVYEVNLLNAKRQKSNCYQPIQQFSDNPWYSCCKCTKGFFLFG